MEKYTQFRDKGSGVSPFLPVTSSTPSSSVVQRFLAHVFHGLIFVVRFPFFLAYSCLYFLVLHHIPFLPTAIRKLLLWGVMAVCGVWWVDLQIDGVRRGTLAGQSLSRVPHRGTVIAANATSPLDALYLATIFDPIFTVSYPRSRFVRRVGLLGAVSHALGPVQLTPTPGKESKLVDLAELHKQHPNRIIVVFPECSTTNGKGILPLSPSLLSLPSTVPIFPVSLRYTPADVTTPIPGRWVSFLYPLLSHTSTYVRVRIAQSITNTATSAATKEATGRLTSEERAVLDRVGEALARLSRNKRVGLTLEDKQAFVQAWTKRR